MRSGLPDAGFHCYGCAERMPDMGGPDQFELNLKIKQVMQWLSTAGCLMLHSECIYGPNMCWTWEP